MTYVLALFPFPFPSVSSVLSAVPLVFRLLSLPLLYTWPPSRLFILRTNPSPPPSRLSISIDPTDPYGSDSSLTDEEDSSVVQVSLPSDGSHENQDYDEWAHLSYPDELKPSDSASRQRTSHRTRSLHGSRSASGRRQPSRRQMIERESMGSRARQRHRSPESPGSAESEEYQETYARNTHERRWPPPPPAPPAGYAQSASSGPSFNAYPPAPGHASYPHANGPLPGDQLIRFGHANPAGPPYGPGHGPYPYGAQLPSSGAPMYAPYYAQDQAHRHPRPPPQPRIDPHNPSQPPMHPMGGHGPSPYAASPFHHELMPYAPNGYYNYRDPYSLVQGMMPQSYFPSYPQVSSPPQPEAASPPAPTPASAPTPAPAPPPADAAKDEAIARLEKLILDDRTEREKKEAARLAAIEREAAEAAAKAQQLAHDRKIAEEAAMLARADAEKKAAEDAAKAKEEAEKAAAAAASEAAAAATAAAATATATAAAAAADASSKPAPEKKKPIKFKDAVGRKFSFPFELCSTWQVRSARFLPSRVPLCD